MSGGVEEGVEGLVHVVAEGGVRLFVKVAVDAEVMGDGDGLTFSDSIVNAVATANLRREVGDADAQSLTDIAEHLSKEEEVMATIFHSVCYFLLNIGLFS